MKFNFDFLNLTFKNIGIDLGTSNILVAINGKGIVYNEPSVLALDSNTGDVLAIGKDAKEMLGRTPNKVKAIRPIKDGVIADLTATRILLKKIMQNICRKNKIGRYRAVIGVPYGITEVEERAVEEAVISAGAKEVFLIEEPIAAAIGANIPISEPSGNIIVDIGGGTTEVAVISLGGIVASNSIRIAGDDIDESIVNYIKKEHNILIGLTTAEELKINIGCVIPLMSKETMEVKGRDLSTGLPKTITMDSEQVNEAIIEQIDSIIETIKITLEKTPPELSSDIMEKGIVVSGGGALIRNMDKLIEERTKMPVVIAENPLNCVVKGTEKTLGDIEKLKAILANSRKNR